MKIKHGESNRLATTMLGLCGLVFAAAACEDTTPRDDGMATTATVNPTEGTDAGSTGDDSSAETGSAGSSDSGDDANDSGPPPEGLGCDVQPTCDKGTYQGSLILANEASMADIQGYTDISGFLIVRDSEYTCLDFLACLETARGINIENNQVLGNLDGLSNLREVLFNVTISRNAELVDLSGLNALTKVSSDQDGVQLGPRGIIIFDNPGLEVLDAFPELSEIEGDVAITNNGNLVEIAGFDKLVQVIDHPNADKSPGQPPRSGGSVIISRNKVLEKVTGFTGLAVIFKNLTIQFNDVLTKLTGLYNLQALGGALIITNNPELCVSEAFHVGGDLEQGPLDQQNSSTANNKEC